MSFEPIKRLRLGEQIASAIRDAIISGRYAAGSLLPSERDLAEQFSVARTSVREALHRLEAWGLVELRHGAAPKVQDFLASVGIQLLPHLIAPGGKLDATLFADLMQLRAGLLAWVAGQAASRFGEASTDEGTKRNDALADLRSLVDKLETAASAQSRQALDLEFFMTLIGLTENRVMILIANAVSRLYRAHQKLFASLYEDALFDPRHHRRVVEAIALGERAEAASAMEAFGLSALNSEVLRCP
ncbi:MAG: FadR family transcriptional regulator [Deltaproteobacteria bacterium]|nr:FadR family transcriptional regulator [Deltaproteobacteria bacterium]